MWKTNLTLHCTFCFLFLLLGQAQLGFGGNEVGVQRDGSNAGPKSFRAFSSLFFRPGTDYTVFFTVNPHPNNEPLQLKCVLMANSTQSVTLESNGIFLLPGESGHVTIPLPREMPGDETHWRLFTWSVTEDSKANGYTEEAPHTLIVSSELADPERRSQTKADLASVFIQTDKPAYKPDDLVRFRVITMGSDDLPHLTAGVNITITDSQRNLMKKWEQPVELPESASVPSNVSTKSNVALFGEFQKKTNGLSAYEYQLSSEPILGNWTIEVQAGKIKEKMYFDVQTYILPKFQVKVKVPPVLYGTGDSTTAATIQVSYTYGKGLQGSGNVTVTSSNDARVKIQQFVLKDGEAQVPLTLSSPRGSSSTVHTIMANVTEKNTGRWRTGTATVRIFPQETYKIEWINKPSSYKPGLPFTVVLKILGQDGFPANDVRAKTVKITFPSSLNLKEISIPLSGIVKFTFVTPLQPTSTNSKFEVHFSKTKQDFTLPSAERGTSSGIFIDVVPPPNSVQLIQGNSYNFTVRSNKPIQPEAFNCLLWNDAAMEVHGAQLIKNTNQGNATEFPFSLQLPKGAYTDLKIFVYFESNEGGTKQLISTSKSINTHNYLKIRVSRPTAIKNPDVSSTAAPSPDAPAETTAATTTTSTTTTTTTTKTTTTTAYEIEYDNELQDDDPAAGEPQPLLSDTLQVQPGDPVEIHFETYPDSTIAIRGIDQSLLLLTEQDNDLNPEKVKEKRASAELLRKFHLENITTDNSTFLKTFHRIGISVLSSSSFTSFAAKDIGETGFEDNLEEPDVAPSDDTVSDDDDDNNNKRIPEVDTRLRTKFPETWLWEEFQSSSDSSSTVLRKTLPDTLTSWIISGFSLNPKTGLGVASPAKITGFLNFFVTLNLPYSVIKYETFDLQVIVHNYLDRDVNVQVNLLNKQDSFSFFDSRDQKNGNATRYIKVQKNQVAVAHFVITPMALGDIPIEVKAVTEDGTAGDSMIRPLKVKPDGDRRSQTELVIFSRLKNPDANLTREARFDVKFPDKVVKGASSLQLTVIGDSMGTMVANLGHLLRLPGGCGEQNMGRFVPNILALHYISATNSDAKTVMQEARTNLENGYSHQLQYKKPDGSFAIYRSNAGTVWLTSYVLRWFVVAQQHITIDPNIIRGATNFIRSKQQSDGSFVETGPFYHPEMRGQSGANGVALTAYITLALIKANETSNSDLNLKVAILIGLNFLSRDSVYQLDDNYITNLVTATLVAGNHPDHIRFFEKMEKGANTTTTKEGAKEKYWNMLNGRDRASGPLAIEMTSYALLAHLWRRDKTDSSVFNIHRWLLNQQNPQGGFISTQDTTMGLTALTEFALRTKGNFRKEDQLQLSFEASSNFDTVKTTELSVSVAHWNRMVLQEFTLPASTKKVHVYARGSGPALIQLTQTWHVPRKVRLPRSPPDQFNVIASMTIPDADEPQRTELRLCVNSFTADEVTDSIASVDLPSGYLFEREDFEEDSDFMAGRPKNVQRFEVKEGFSKLDVYFNSVPQDPPVCINLSATQVHKVASLKNPPIVVYEYLNPDNAVSIIYLPPLAHRTSACQLCNATSGCEKEGC